MTVRIRTRAMDRARRLLGGLMLTSLLLGVAVPTAAQGSPNPAPMDDPRIPHDVPTLEALVPGSVDGRPLFRMSMGRPSLALMATPAWGTSMRSWPSWASSGRTWSWRSPTTRPQARCSTTWPSGWRASPARRSSTPMSG